MVDRCRLAYCRMQRTGVSRRRLRIGQGRTASAEGTTTKQTPPRRSVEHYPEPILPRTNTGLTGSLINHRETGGLKCKRDRSTLWLIVGPIRFLSSDGRRFCLSLSSARKLPLNRPRIACDKAAAHSTNPSCTAAVVDSVSMKSQRAMCQRRQLRAHPIERINVDLRDRVAFFFAERHKCPTPRIDNH